jgi:hypothetical protein
VVFVRSSVSGGVPGVKCCAECIVFFRGVGRSRRGSVLPSMWCMVVFVVSDMRVPHHVRRSHFLLRLYEVGPALQPKGGEHVYLSSRRNIDP